MCNNQTGNYTVNLTVTDANGLSNQSSIVQVTHADDPEGMFTSSVKTGPAPLTVSFIDQSSGTAPLTYAWDFGDLTPIKYEQNPVHVYTDPGVYNVTLEVSGPRGSDVIYQNELINVTTPGGPQARFTAVPSSGHAPLNVSFHRSVYRNRTSHVYLDLWRWQFVIEFEKPGSRV